MKTVESTDEKRGKRHDKRKKVDIVDGRCRIVKREKVHRYQGEPK